MTWPSRSSNRREFIRDLGIGAAAVPFILNLPSLGFANQARRKQRLVIMFSPNGVVPSTFWPDEEGEKFALKESLKPLEPFKNRTLILHGVCDKVRGDGDNHMRGMGCLLTGIELFPGNIQGGSDTPAGWANGISIDQEIKNHLQATAGHAHAVRLAGVRRDGARPGRHLDPHGLRRAEQADRADRRPLPDVRQALRPDEGPGEPQEHPRRPPGRPEEGRLGGQRRGPAAARRARDVRPRDGAGAASDPNGKDVGHAVPELEPGVKHDNDKHAPASARCRST